MYRPLTAEERAVMQAGVEDVYHTFTTRVADGRKMDIAKVDEIGGGRVWSGENAKGLGLVDEFGGLTYAIKVAAQKAGLKGYRILELPAQKEPFEQFLQDFSTEAKIWFLKDDLSETFKQYTAIKNMLKNQGIEARMPYDIELY